MSRLMEHRWSKSPVVSKFTLRINSVGIIPLLGQNLKNHQDKQDCFLPYGLQITCPLRTSSTEKRKVMNAVNPRGVPLSMSKFCHSGPSKVHSRPTTQHLRTTQSLVSNSHTLPLGIASGLKTPGVSDLTDTVPNHCVKWIVALFNLS